MDDCSYSVQKTIHAPGRTEGTRECDQGGLKDYGIDPVHR